MNITILEKLTSSSWIAAVGVEFGSVVEIDSEEKPWRNHTRERREGYINKRDRRDG